MMNKLKISRGDIWYVDLDPTVGHEQAKRRPCLIVSPSTFNQGPSELVVVVPLTSKYRSLPWFVILEADQSGLPVRSYIICNQIRTISIDRISGHCLGNVPAPVMAQVESRLRILLNI